MRLHESFVWQSIPCFQEKDAPSYWANQPRRPCSHGSASANLQPAQPRRGRQPAREDLFGVWFLVSKGPDGSNAPLPVGFADGNSQNDWLWQLYDPTNGTISTGDVIRGQAGDANAAGYRYAVTY